MTIKQMPWQLAECTTGKLKENMRLLLQLSKLSFEIVNCIFITILAVFGCFFIFPLLPSPSPKKYCYTEPIQPKYTPHFVNKNKHTSYHIERSIQVNTPGVTVPSYTSFPPYQRTRDIAP